jgi:hypothetical protein
VYTVLLAVLLWYIQWLIGTSQLEKGTLWYGLLLYPPSC